MPNTLQSITKNVPHKTHFAPDEDRKKALLAFIPTGCFTLSDLSDDFGP